MAWESRYLSPTRDHWQGRADSPENACFFQIIAMLDLNQPLPQIKQPAFAIIGFCCDEGIKRNLGRTGANEGPDAIRQSLAKLPIQTTSVICYDAGNIQCEDGNLEEAQQALSDVVALLLRNHITPIVLGGGHEVAWGHYQGIAKQFPNKNLGIVNFDAHFDMRPLLPNEKGSSGTPFLQIAEAHHKNNRRFDYNCIGIQPAGNTRELFQTAKRHHAHVMLADDFYQQSFEDADHFIDRIIQDNDLIYLSLCLDVFTTAVAPGVSAPQPLGLTPWQVLPLFRKLAASGKVVSYDIAELSPKYDTDQRTAKLAANFVFNIIHFHHSN